MTLIAHDGWMLQVALAGHDTVFLQPAGHEPTWFATIANVASGLVSIVLLVLLVALVFVVRRALHTQQRISELLERLTADLKPITGKAGTVVENVEYITAAVRSDVQQVSATVRTANERLQRLLVISERRLRDFDALLRLVRDEATETVVSTAATLRGMRAGMREMREELYEDLTQSERLDGDDDALDEDEVIDNGDDDTTAVHRGPRIKRRHPRGTAR